MVGASENPCLSSDAPLTASSITATGTTTTQTSSSATNPPIDCFYVYPTVSKETTLNSDLTITSEQREVAIEQASRFSTKCRVFAPMYRQVTDDGLFTSEGILNGTGTSKGQQVAFASLLLGWQQYLKDDNKGRGVVLIGHSQGAFLLRELITKDIDSDTAVRKLIVSAILLGGNVEVPTGKLVGGDFHHVPACTTSSELGCVVAYSTYEGTPPSDSLFGRTTTPGHQVLCVSPSALLGTSPTVTPYFPTRLGYSYDSVISGGVTATPWVTYPGLFTASCQSSGGAHWLNLTETRSSGDHRPVLASTQPASWGLHLQDFNVDLGNLVDLVSAESAAWHHFHPSAG
jgi:hypothetical protein